MVKKLFLALDYDFEHDAINAFQAANSYLRPSMSETSICAKINGHSFMDKIDPSFDIISDREIFADLKLASEPEIGEQALYRISNVLPIRYATVFAGLGKSMLRSYASFMKKMGVLPVAYTVHTKINEADAKEVYGRSSRRQIERMGYIAADAGFHAMVVDGNLLQFPEISKLPIKKLVTGVRIDVKDRGDQARPTSLDYLSGIKEKVDYVVVSKRYLSNENALEKFAQLL